MGKPNPTYGERLQQWCESWQPVERALRRQDREPFQQLLADTHEHAMVGGHRNPPTVEGTALRSICLQQQLRIEERQEAVEGADGSTRDD